MAWPDVVVVVRVLLPGAVPLGAYAYARGRLRAELPPTAFRSVRATWLTSAAAMFVGVTLVAYTSP